MAQGNRPGGLTALAVLNFVFFGFACIALIGMGVALGLDGKTITDLHGKTTTFHVGPAEYAGLAILAVSSTCLLVSGIGYLKMRRTMGRMFGNTYAVLSLAGTALSVATAQGGAGMSIGVILFMIYPLVTLLLINTTFSEDLTQ